MATIINTLLLILSTSVCLQAQNAHITFNKIYGGNDTINMLAQAVVPVDSGYLVFGNYATTSIPYGLGLTQIDQQGNVLQFNNIDSTSFFDNMGIYWGAEALVENNGVSLLYGKGKDISLVKFNFNGDTLWYKRLLKIGWQAGEQIIKTHDNGYMIAGLEVNLTQDTVRGYVLRIDSVGNFLWDKTYTMGNDARFFSIQSTPWDGGYILGGMGYTPTTGYDMFVVKTDSIGDTLWTRRYGSNQNDCLAMVVPTVSREDYEAGAPIEYIMTGCYQTNEPDILWGYVDELYMAKLDSIGQIIWENVYYNSPNNLSIQTLPIMLPDDGFIAAGVYFTQLYIARPRIIKFNSDGSIAWHKDVFINSNKNCYIKDMRPTADGGYVLAGYQYDTPQTAWVLKIDSLGNTCSFVGCDSTIYTGYPIGLTEIAIDSYIKVSPNPAQNTIQIAFNNIATTPTDLQITDLYGRCLLQIPTYNGDVLNIAQLNNGIYFCKALQNGKLMGTVKFVVIR